MSEHRSVQKDNDKEKKEREEIQRPGSSNSGGPIKENGSVPPDSKPDDEKAA